MLMTADAILAYGAVLGGHETGWQVTCTRDNWLFDDNLNPQQKGVEELFNDRAVAWAGLRYVPWDNAPRINRQIAERAWDKLGVQFLAYGDYDHCVYMLAAHAVIAHRRQEGHPDITNLALGLHRWGGKLAVAADALGLELPEPRWVLASWTNMPDALP